jgi:hypothetical protein
VNRGMREERGQILEDCASRLVLGTLAPLTQVSALAYQLIKVRVPAWVQGKV